MISNDNFYGMEAMNLMIKKNTIHLVIMFSYDVILDYTIIGTPDLKIINMLLLKKH